MFLWKKVGNVNWKRVGGATLKLWCHKGGKKEKERRDVLISFQAEIIQLNENSPP